MCLWERVIAMHFVILFVFVAAVYGRDLSDAGYYPARPYDRYDRRYINSPPPEERYEGNYPNRDNYENHRHVDFNMNRQVNYEYHEDLSNNDRNGRRHNFPNTEHTHTNGVVRDMDVNLGFERQSPKRHRDGNLHLPKQSFNVNDEYSKRDVTNNDNNRSYYQNSPRQRSDGDMVFRDDEDDRVGRKTTVNPNYNNQNNNGPEIGIISFLNNVNTNTTDTKINSKKQTETQGNGSNNHSQFELKSGTVENTNQRPSKTTIENEVTPNPFRTDTIAKENKTVEGDKWVWSDGGDADVEVTTMTTTLVTLDDRAAFDGGKCATGMARVQGICVKPD